MARQPKVRGTTSEAEIRALCAEGMNFVQIAEHLNLNVQSLRNACSVLGIRSGDYRSGGPGIGQKRSMERLLGWVDRLSHGDSIGDIARDEGCSRENVNAQLRRAGLPSSVRAAVKAKHAAVAQSVELPACIGPVAGSIPAGGTTSEG